MSLLIALEYHPRERTGQGAFAVQLSRRGRWLRWYPRWCVRGFNAGHRRYGMVAIVSGVYRYRIDHLYGKDPRPLLIGKGADGQPLAGGRIRTIAPNHFQDGQWFADRIWLHGMKVTPEIKTEYHTDCFIGSSACHGPPETGIDRLMANYQPADAGYYLLIRPTEPFEHIYRWLWHRLLGR
jgi:hypothetical protein